MSKRFIAVLLGMFLLTAVAFFYVLYQGSTLTPLKQLPTANAPAQPTAPPVPGASLSILTSKQGNTFVVQWHDLPDGTVMLDIFRRPINSTSSADWKLWKQVTLTPGQLASGLAQFDIGNASFDNYSYTVEAESDTSQGIIWSSSSTEPIVSTSTPPAPAPPDDNNNPPAPSPTSTPVIPSTTPSSTINNSPSSTNGNNPPPPTPPATPAGTPYYSPQIQISGYGQSPTGNFWVQHTDQKIQIGWQNLPPQTTGVAVLRSSSQDGPWNTILTQQNPVIQGPYSIQLVDDSVDQPYYYEMTIFSGSAAIGTYGPAYLAAVGQ